MFRPELEGKELVHVFAMANMDVYVTDRFYIPVIMSFCAEDVEV